MADTWCGIDQRYDSEVAMTELTRAAREVSRTMEDGDELIVQASRLTVYVGVRQRFEI